MLVCKIEYQNASVEEKIHTSFFIHIYLNLLKHFSSNVSLSTILFFALQNTLFFSYIHSLLGHSFPVVLLSNHVYIHTVYINFNFILKQ